MSPLDKTLFYPPLRFAIALDPNALEKDKDINLAGEEPGHGSRNGLADRGGAVAPVNQPTQPANNEADWRIHWHWIKVRSGVKLLSHY